MANNFSSFIDDKLIKYASDFSLREDLILKSLRDETQDLVGKEMQISPEQGQFMAMLVKLIKAKRILEIGTFTGYSTIVMAMALPEDGRIVTCDKDKKPTDIAKKYWKLKNIDHKINLHLGQALDSLKIIQNTNAANSFDLIFIDADKANYINYYEISLELLKPEGLMLIDNTLWYGRVIDDAYEDNASIAIRKFNQKLKDDPRIEINLLPIYDGLSMVYKKPS